jgi:hypothetical protein
MRTGSVARRSRELTRRRSELRRRPDDHHAPAWLRDRIETDYRRARPFGKPHAHQLDALAEMAIWLSHCYRHDGREIHRTWPQIVGALEKRGVQRRDGSFYRRELGAKATSRRYRHTLGRRLCYLQEMGWIEGFEAQYDARGEGTGILIQVGDDVAKLAIATAPRARLRGGTDFSSAPLHRRSSISPTLHAPSGVVQPRRTTNDLGSDIRQGCATRNERLVDDAAKGTGLVEGTNDPGTAASAESPGNASKVSSGEWGVVTRVELAAALAAGYDPGELLADILELADRPLVAERELLIAVFEHALGQPALYSPGRWDGRMFAALERLDRYAGEPGAGCAELLEAIEHTALELRTLDAARDPAFEAQAAAIRAQLGAAEPSPLDRERARAGLLGPGGLPLAPKSLSLFVFHAEQWIRARGPEYRLNRRIARARRLLERAVDERLNRRAGPDPAGRCRSLERNVEEHARQLCTEEPHSGRWGSKQQSEEDREEWVRAVMGDPTWVARTARELVLARFEDLLEQELARRAEGRWCRIRWALRQTDRRFDLGLALYGADNVRWRKTWRNV